MCMSETGEVGLGPSSPTDASSNGLMGFLANRFFVCLVLCLCFCVLSLFFSAFVSDKSWIDDFFSASVGSLCLQNEDELILRKRLQHNRQANSVMDGTRASPCCRC